MIRSTAQILRDEALADGIDLVIHDLLCDAADEIERLVTVAKTAKELTQTAYETDAWITAVDDRVLTALETALAEAGYDMTDEELKTALQSETDGEAD